MYIDTSQIGAISLIEDSKINDNKDFKTGTLITVPILKNDVNAFLSYICYYLSFTHSNYIFNRKGKPMPFNAESYRNPLMLYSKNWGISPSNNSYRNKSDQSVVLIEDIPYNIKLDNLINYLKSVNESYLLNNIKDKSNLLDKTKQKKLLINFIENISSYEYEIKLDIGSLDVSASREDLQYTEKTCRNLSIGFYKMLLQLLHLYKIHCIENPSYYQACKISYLYSIKNSNNNQELFYDFTWKDKPGYPLYTSTFRFSSQEIFYNKYKISSDKLKKVEQRGNCISFSYDYIFCNNDVEDCKSIPKYIKYYLLNTTNTYNNTNLLLIESSEFNKLDKEIELDFKIVKLSEIIAFYKEENKKEKLNKPKQEPTTKEYVNVLQFKGKHIVRPSCYTLGAYFDYEPTLIKDDITRYYIVQDTPDLLNWNDNLINDCLFKDSAVKSLCTYLNDKNIDYNNLYLIKKKTRTYDNKSWVDLSDVIIQDYNLYKNYMPQIIFYSFLNNLYKNFYSFSYDYGTNVFSALKKYSSNINNKLFKQLESIYIKAVDFMENPENKFLINFCNLLNKEVRYVLYPSFIKSSEFESNPIYSLCKEMIQLEQDLKNNMYLLHDIQLDRNLTEYYKAYVEYINFFNLEERNDLDKFKFIQPSLSWDYSTLFNKYINEL